MWTVVKRRGDGAGPILCLNILYDFYVILCIKFTAILAKVNYTSPAFIKASVYLLLSRVALSTWPEAWESHERMGSPGQAFLISCGESPKPGKQTFAHFFTISTWGKRQLTWGKRQLPSPCWDCINFFLPAYCEKQPGIRYWYRFNRAN